MNRYESIFIVNPKLEEEKRKRYLRLSRRLRSRLEFMPFPSHCPFLPKSVRSTGRGREDRVAPANEFSESVPFSPPVHFDGLFAINTSSEKAFNDE